jgi:hypothetical protein
MGVPRDRFSKEWAKKLGIPKVGVSNTSSQNLLLPKRVQCSLKNCGLENSFSFTALPSNSLVFLFYYSQFAPSQIFKPVFFSFMFFLSK